MKILVTGGTGFLGAHLCARLKAEGHAVTAFGSALCDLRRPEALARFGSEPYDQIYHLAAWTQAGDFCLHHPGEQWVINQQINTNVVAWWQARQPQAKLIAIGSSCCYAPEKPHREENFLSGLPTESLLSYGFTKRMLYVGLSAMRRQFGLRFLVLVPATLYGPGYHLDGRQMHFIFDLLRKIADGKRRGVPVVLWGDGAQTRELIHIRDFTDAAVRLAREADNEIVNIGSGEEYSIRWYAEELSRLVGYDSALIQYDASKYVGAKAKRLEVDRLRRLLPDFRCTDLKAGLKELTEWYLKATSGLGA